MFGIEFPGLIRFFIQVSTAVAGASSLWGFSLLWRARHAKGERAEAFEKLARMLLVMFLASAGVLFLVWWYALFALYPMEAGAHEGIVLKPMRQELVWGFANNVPFIVFLMISALGSVWALARKERFGRYGITLFLTQFFLASVILLLGTTAETFGIRQIFFWFHSWHSILTTGTVVTVDALYIATMKRNELKRVLYPFFPIMSAGIWIGLGIDFTGVLLIVNEALYATQQFFFNQTVVAIIVLNGVLLSGRANDILMRLITPNGVNEPSPNTSRLLGLAGSISIVSWLTITFIDFFTLTLSYGSLLAIYVALIVLVFFCETLAKRIIVGKA